MLLTLFIGVVATSMEEATDDQKQAADVERRVVDIRRENDLDFQAIELYREVFAALDLNAGNSIDSNELRLGMKAAGRSDVTDEQFRKLWRAVDRDNSGGIDFAEFLSFMMSLRKTTTNQLHSHVSGDSSEDQKVVASNTLTVAEQLYNIASSIGPLDSSVRMKELVKKTSLGRPNSAPRVLNRLYSHEHNVYEPKDSFEESPSLDVKTPTLTAPVARKSISVEVGPSKQNDSKQNDSVRVFNAPGDARGTENSHQTISPACSAALHQHLSSETDLSIAAEGNVALSAKPGSKPGSNRHIFSRGDARVVPSAGVMEGDRGAGGGSAFVQKGSYSVPSRRSDLDSTGKVPSPTPWTGRVNTPNDTEMKDRSSPCSSGGKHTQQQIHSTHLNVGDASTPPSRGRRTKMKKVVSRVCFI